MVPQYLLHRCENLFGRGVVADLSQHLSICIHEQKRWRRDSCPTEFLSGRYHKPASFRIACGPTVRQVKIEWNKPAMCQANNGLVRERTRPQNLGSRSPAAIRRGAKGHRFDHQQPFPLTGRITGFVEWQYPLDARAVCFQRVNGGIGRNDSCGNEQGKHVFSFQDRAELEQGDQSAFNSTHLLRVTVESWFIRRHSTLSRNYRVKLRF